MAPHHRLLAALAGGIGLLAPAVGIAQSEPLHAPGSWVRVALRDVRGSGHECRLRPGDWVAVSWQPDLYYLYESGKSLAFARQGAGVMLSKDNAPQRLAGVLFDEPGGMQMLRSALKDGATPLTVCCSGRSLASLPRFPAGSDVSLVVELRDVSDLTALSAQPHLTSLHLLRTIGIEAPERMDLEPLATLTRLRALSLWLACPVRDIAPLGRLSKLTSLELHGLENVADLGPLAALTKLRRLRLSSCHAFHDLAPLAALENLTSLALLNCDQVVDLAPIGRLGALTELEVLYCGGIHRLDPVARLRRLEAIHVLDCERVSDVKPVAQLANLTELWVSSQQIRDYGALAAMANLVDLRIRSPQPVDVSFLAGMTKLEALHVAPKRLSPLAELPDLRSLSVSRVESLAQCPRLPRLTSLEISGSLPSLSGIERLPNLMSLGLKGCNRVRDLAPVSQLRELVSLRLRDCENVTDLDPLGKLPRLRRVDLRGCEGITDLRPLATMVRGGGEVLVDRHLEHLVEALRR